MSHVKYYVVEARLPVQINDADSPADAAQKAARRLSFEYGVDVSNWFLRVFVYGGEDEMDVGPQETWFCNPSGTKFRKLDENILSHAEMIEKGMTPDGPSTDDKNNIPR